MRCLEISEFGRFRTGQNFNLWNLVFVVCCQLSCVLHEFSFFCMTCLRVLCAETTVICFAVMWRFVHLLAVGFGLSYSLPQVCYTFVLSETLSYD